MANGAAKLLQANNEFIDLLSILNGSSNITPLQIGSRGSHSKIIMNKLLESLESNFPKLECDVITNNSAEILNLVKNGQLDCGIVSEIVPDYLDKKMLYQDHISLYTH